MKRLHRDDLFGWSRFDESRNIDFHSVLWVRGAAAGGNVAIDPLPLSAHDERHMAELGGVSTIVITNSDHVRDTRVWVERFGARVIGPRAERQSFPIVCDGWVGDGDRPLADLQVLELEGSKTPGELALVIDASTLVVGDLVRAHRAGRLNLLPDAKLTDRLAARSSVARLAALPNIDAVLVGDGWPVFRDGARALSELLSSLG